MSEDTRTRPPCSVCGGQIDDGEWLLLNRYAVGFGTGRAMTSATNDDGEYWWDLDDDDDDVITGPVMHWPVCATQYVDARMAEWRVRMRSGKEGQR